MSSLLIGARMYSSWSLRGWLVFDAFDLPVKIRHVHLTTPDFTAALKDFAPAALVPALKTGHGVIWDSLAIAETLAEQHRDLNMWPQDPGARGMARSLAAEMHSGFAALRGDCPMNLSTAYSDYEPPADVRANVDRIEMLWALARERFGDGGDWLFGSYSLADVMFAPVAARIAGYGIAVGAVSQAYVQAHLTHPSFRRWRAMAHADHRHLARYEKPLIKAPWPGPAPRDAHALPEGAGERPLNATCPFSGNKVRTDSRAVIDGKVIGFCNVFCRDKSVADADAWPDVVALLDG